MTLICPVCGQELVPELHALKCQNGHCFDVARHNYVNLLMSNVSAEKRHGDDKAMVSSRTEFLDAGYYDGFRDGIVAAAVKSLPRGAAIVDAGCGEGFYTAAVRQALSADICGVDISKAALMSAHRRDMGLTLAVAGINRLPVADGSCDGVMNIFAPCDSTEFSRVLRPTGVLIRGIPTERHLFGLKTAVYDSPYLNPSPDTTLEGFELVDRTDINGKITLTSGKDLHNLFMMTPYYYKTGREDQQKLESLSSLETELGFAVLTYRKK